MEAPERLKDVQVFNEMPEGWGYLIGTTTAPRGYRWIWNCKSRFTGKNHGCVNDYQHALLREVSN